MRSLRGCGYLSVMGTQYNSTLGLSAFSFGPYYLKAYDFGSILPTAACRGGVHIGGVASGVSTPQASEVGMRGFQGAQCGVVSSHPRSGHISHCILAWYMFGFGSS